MQNVVQLDYSSPIGLRSLIESFSQLSYIMYMYIEMLSLLDKIQSGQELET